MYVAGEGSGKERRERERKNKPGAGEGAVVGKKKHTIIKRVNAPKLFGRGILNASIAAAYVLGIGALSGMAIPAVSAFTMGTIAFAKFCAIDAANHFGKKHVIRNKEMPKLAKRSIYTAAGAVLPIFLFGISPASAVQMGAGAVLANLYSKHLIKNKKECVPVEDLKSKKKKGATK